MVRYAPWTNPPRKNRIIIKNSLEAKAGWVPWTLAAGTLIAEMGIALSGIPTILNIFAMDMHLGLTIVLIIIAIVAVVAILLMKSITSYTDDNEGDEDFLNLLSD